MMSPIDFRLKVLAQASTAYAVAHPQQPPAASVGFASQLADECVREAARLGLFGPAPAPQSAVEQTQATQPIMAPPLQGFAHEAQVQQQGALEAQMQQQAQANDMMQQQQSASPIGSSALATQGAALQGTPIAGTAIATAPVPAAPQIPMQPLQSAGGPQMQIHPASSPIPQMPIPATMAAAVPQVPMHPQQAVPQVQPPQQAPFQPFGPNGPTIPLPQQAFIPPTMAAPTQEGAPPVQTGGFQPPPPPMGGTNKVVQAPMPQNFSALGGIGVQEKVEQRPMAQDAVITPGNQPVIQGGKMAETVQEKITH